VGVRAPVDEAAAAEPGLEVGPPSATGAAVEGLAIGVDVGGTKLAAGVVDAAGTVLAHERRDTPADDVEALTALIAETALGLCARLGHDALPVGVGAAGMIDLDGVVRYAPNIGWRDYPLRARLAALLGAPVMVENDANVAAWGEYRVGAGRAARSSMTMLTVGTGVGGGLVLADRLVRGASGVGAEFGHLVLSEGGPACNCGNRGDLEALASGTAIGRMAREAVEGGEVDPGSPLGQAALLDGKAVTRAAEAGDPVAVGILERAGFWLGVGIGSLVNVLDPEIVVLGGGAMQAEAFILPAARAAALDRMMGREYRDVPEIVPARLADEAGLVGAALLVHDETARRA